MNEFDSFTGWTAAFTTYGEHTNYSVDSYITHIGMGEDTSNPIRVTCPLPLIRNLKKNEIDPVSFRIIDPTSDQLLHGDVIRIEFQRWSNEKLQESWVTSTHPRLYPTHQIWNHQIYAAYAMRCNLIKVEQPRNEISFIEED